MHSLFTYLKLLLYKNIICNEQFFFFLSPLQKSSKGGSGVKSYPTFDPSADVVALDKAITVKGK